MVGCPFKRTATLIFVKDSAMQNFTLYTKVHFGEGALSHLSKLKFKNAFIIADPFVVKSGLIKNVTSPLDAASIKYDIYSNVTPDPSVQNVVDGVAALMRECQPCLIAVGGGSAIDLAKCVRQFANKTREDYFPHFIAIPTTSGTGSEVTAFAVITDTEKNIKHALYGDELLPEDAIIDVEMVKSVPAGITADTGMDVMTHAIEAYVSTRANVFSDMYAKKATQICKDYLVRSYKFDETGDVEAREQMHIASNLAGAAFNAVSLGLNHGMAHQLGAQFHIPHGRANALLLPNIISYNTGIHQYTHSMAEPSECAKKYAALAHRIGVGSYNDIASVKSLMSYIDEMRTELHLPRTVRDAAPNVTRAEYMSRVDAMAEAALADRCTATNPRVPTKMDVVEMFLNLY